MRLPTHYIKVKELSMPTKRQATLTLSGPEDQTVVLMADFDQLTLTRTQVGGYQREPNGAKPISPEASESFWKQLEKLATNVLRDGDFDMVGGIVWKFEARDGKKSYAAIGLLRDQHYVGYVPKPDSYADLCALFELLKH
jgi:hypothetical protein